MNSSKPKATIAGRCGAGTWPTLRRCFFGRGPEVSKAKLGSPATLPRRHRRHDDAGVDVVRNDLMGVTARDFGRTFRVPLPGRFLPYSPFCCWQLTEVRIA